MTSWFVDSSVLLVGAGAEHPRRGDCRALLARAVEPGIDVHASVESVQEFLFHRMRMVGRDEALTLTRDLATTLVLHEFDDAVLLRSFDLIASSTVRGRDAVIAATALLAGFETLVSLDADFDGVPGLTRVVPEPA